MLLEIVREYASALLARTGAADVVHARLLDWAVTFAREARDGLEHAEPDTVRRVDLADAALSSALDHAVDTGRGLVDAAGIAVDLAFGWSLRGRCTDGLARVPSRQHQPVLGCRRHAGRHDGERRERTGDGPGRPRPVVLIGRSGLPAPGGHATLFG